MTVGVPSSVLSRYARFSLYNSPYPAHDCGCAIDLYPGTLEDGRTTAAPSPVSGVVRETRTVRAPPKPYAPTHDHLLLVDCDEPPELEGLIARILHVEPAVEAGDRVEMGDSLGELVRAGFFAPWVDNHLHVGVRRPDQNLRRATGSLRLEPDVEIRPLAWDGTGTVVATGETYAVLDAPTHPNPGPEFVGIGVGRGNGDHADGFAGVLDGGLPHYDGGGLLETNHRRTRGVSDHGTPEGPLTLAGERIGTLETDGRTINWDDVVVTANGDPVTGLSTFCARDGGFGAKLVGSDHGLAVGERVRVGVRRG
ncbi:hypothetical protein [Natrialba swarupiae]|uniref:M23 family metallopeptidase n=1 Tax=Natrialba swarupiae TaxID=2448032 RepID=A0A5D5AYJ2_9EURY|nr:hypothetical protein [Natrialba swarupiae]TYT63961.1 hypothetical protein FYC77_01785 [Natrialba swarupiae]